MQGFEFCEEEFYNASETELKENTEGKKRKVSPIVLSFHARQIKIHITQ